MPESEEILKMFESTTDAEKKRSILRNIDEDPVVKEEYIRLKNTSALLASMKEMPDYQLEDMYLRFQKNFNSPPKSLRIKLNSIMRYAAVFIIAAGLTSFFFYLQQTKNDSKRISGSDLIVYQEISANFASRMKFKLADGTTVQLNSGSKLLFPNKFAGQSRDVILSGEAFFDVTTNPEKPFIVHTNSVDVKVFGTAFNLKAFPDSREVSATLVHGKVAVGRVIDGGFKQLAVLNPSQRAVCNLDNNEIRVYDLQDLDKFIGWKDGKLVFSNDPIQELAEKLGVWYNVTVKIGNEALKYHRFTATFTEEPIEQVLDLLGKSTPLKYKIIKANRLPDNSYSKRTIILN